VVAEVGRDVPGAKAPRSGGFLLFGLKPGPISEATAMVKAKTKTEKKQIPAG
jgi:hypothetical protein